MHQTHQQHAQQQQHQQQQQKLQLQQQQQQQSEHFEAICFTSLTTNNQAVFISAPQSMPPTMRPALRILPSPRSSPLHPKTRLAQSLASRVFVVCPLVYTARVEATRQQLQLQLQMQLSTTESTRH